MRAGSSVQTTNNQVPITSPGDPCQTRLSSHRATAIKPGPTPATTPAPAAHQWICRRARQAVFLDGATKVAELPDLETLKGYQREGIRIVAPPVFALIEAKDGKIVPSNYARNAKQAVLGIITWSPEPGTLGCAGRRQERLLLPGLR